jgi:hypothetical protein
MKRPPALPGAKRLLAAAGCVLAAVSPLAVAAGQDSSWDNYRVLVERNIFLRDRRRARSPAPVFSRMATPTPPDSDRGIVLTGVARRGEESVAFVEQTRTGATFKVGVGEAVGRGKVAAITLDGIDYEREGSVRKIPIGHSLAGEIAAAPIRRIATPVSTRPSGPPRGTVEPTTGPAEPATQPAVAPATTEPAVAPATTEPGSAKESDVTDILERLRRRREQELRR